MADQNDGGVSEYIHNGTSAQLGNSDIHVGKYRTEDKLKIQTIQKLNTTQKKNKQSKTQQNKLPGLVAFYDTRPVVVNKVGLLYNAPKPTRGNRVTGHLPSDASTHNPWNCRRSSCFFWRKPYNMPSNAVVLALELKVVQW